MKSALIVDDTKNIRKLLSTCLEFKGYKVYEASNGHEAISLIMDVSFDIAFIDIKMPEINGTEVLRRIRALGLKFPVIIMTAFPTIKNAVDCTKLGAVVYLQKPFSADKINNLIDTIGGFDASEKEPDVNHYIKIAKDQLNGNENILAFNSLKKALSLNPTNGEIYYLLGVVSEKMSNIDQAKKFYATATQFGYKKD